MATSLRVGPVALPVELELVAACCACTFAGGNTDRLAAAVAAVRDWPRFLRVTARQRVVALVHQTLSAPAAPAIPPEILQSLQRSRTAQTRRNLALAGEALRLDRALTAAGIGAAFLKGLTLAQMLYGEIGLRHSTDIDLLVAPDALFAAEEVLRQAGYRLDQPMGELPFSTISPITHHFVMTSEATKARIEIHWRLYANPILLPRIPAPETWVSIPLGRGQALRTFSKDDLFCFLCVHGAQHGWSRLKWLVDIAAILAGETEDGVARLVRAGQQQGVVRCVAQAMFLANLVLGLDLPPAVVATLPQGWAVRSLVRTGLNILTAGEGETVTHERLFGNTRVLLSHYLLMHDWRYWLAETRYNTFSREDRQTLPLPRWLSPLYLPLRVPLWTWRHARRWIDGLR